MRSRTSRGVPEWSGGKENYIGSAVSAIGKVSGSPGIVPGPPEGSRGSTGWGHLSRRAPWAEVGRELLGNVVEIQNFLRITKINLWSNLAMRGRGVHIHTIVDH